MAKPLRNLLAAVAACAVLGAGAFLLLREEPKTLEGTGNGMAVPARKASEVARVAVKNANGAYTVEVGAAGPTIAGLPPELVNLDYVAMLFDECSAVQYEERVDEQPKDLAVYGLAAPEASVEIAYTDGATLALSIGAEEPVTGGRYFKTSASDAVLLMKQGRTVRFLMPVEKYINYVIVAPNETTSVLSALQDITFSGRQFSQPVVLKAVLEDREDIKRISASFGAATHVITSPGLYEVNQTELSRVADSLFGLISEGIEAYGQTPEQLAAFGFDDPYMQLEFDYKNGKEAPVEHHVLKISTLDGGYIATLDDQGIVYRIADVSFLHTTYESLILRWFLSPFLTDVKVLEVGFGEELHRFELTGNTGKELQAFTEGKVLDAALFKSYYNLIVSAAAEETVPKENLTKGEKLLTVRFEYRDAAKAPDVMTLYENELRRAAVEINGKCEFTIRDKYTEVVRQATEALLAGESFPVQWE